MDREICLQFIDNEINNLYRERNALRHAWIDGDFRKMQSIIGGIRFGTMERLWNLVDRDRYEDWGRVAAKEREQEAKS
jgi:hypothetical protein